MIKILLLGDINEKAVRVLQDSDIYADVKPVLSEDELVNIIPEYHGLIVRSSTKVTANVIKAANKLAIIGRAGVGIDNIDVEAATRRGIVVENSPDCITNAVAEFTIGFLLLLSKKILQSNASTKKGQWEKKAHKGSEINDKVLGIIGLGRIGSKVSKIANHLGMDVIAYDPYVDDKTMQSHKSRKVELDQLLKCAHYISFHVPLTEETNNMLGDPEFQKIKKGTRIINTARGGIVNEEALERAIRSGTIIGAAIDTWETEPLTENNPLLKYEEVIGTAHIAGSTEESQIGVGIAIANQLAEAFRNKKMINVVNGISTLKGGY